MLSRHGLPIEVLLHCRHGVGHGDHVADIMVGQENDFMRHVVCSRVIGSELETLVALGLFPGSQAALKNARQAKSDA